MKRRALADDIARTFDSRLVSVSQLARYTGQSRSSIERGICSRCKPFCVNKRRLYHVSDVAAAMDTEGAQ